MTRRKAQPTPANDGAKLHLAVAPESAPFPEEQLPEEQPSELAHALVGPDRVDNYDRLAVAVPPPAPVAPVQAALRRSAPRTAPRRVSAEVVKAETKLLSFERRRRESLIHHDSVWDDKRRALLKSFPADVLAALEAMSIIEGEEMKGLEP